METAVPVQCPACGTRFQVTPSSDIMAPGTAASLAPPPVFDQPVEAVPIEMENSVAFPAMPSRGGRPGISVRRRGPSAVAIVGLVIAILLTAGSAFVLIMPMGPRQRLAGRGEDSGERQREVRAALIGAEPLTEEETSRQLKVVFDGLGEALDKRDRGRLAGLLDVDRLYDELAAQQVLPRQFAGNRAAFTSGMREGMVTALVNQAPALTWQSYQIRNVKKLADGDVVVIVRHISKNEAVLKMRWWLVRTAGGWKIYDLEDLDFGMRMSTSLGALAGMGLGDMQDAARASNHLRQALLAIVVQEDFVAAEKHMQRLGKRRLPGKLDAARLMVNGMIHMNRNELQEALDDFSEAQRLHPDAPVLELLKGMTYNRLGEWQKGVERLSAYRDLLGDDPVVCYELGEALRGIGKFPEAQASYRTSLDYNPKNVQAYLALLRALAPGDSRDDLEKRFAQLGDPHSNFDTCASDCVEDRDAASLEVIARAMQKIDPKHAAADYHLALAKAWQAKPDEALPPFRAALTKQTDPDKRQQYLAGFMKAIAITGKAPDIYAAMPEPRDAFRFLAAELKEAYRPDELKKLVVAHARGHAEDPLLPFYRGEVLVSEDKYPQAARAFAAGMARPPEAVPLGTFRASRVVAMYHCGQAFDALASVGPRQDTFRQLASLCWQDRNFTLLEKLLAVHAKDEPNDEDLLRYRFGLNIKRDQQATGIADFKTALARVEDENKRDQLIFNFLGDMLDAGAPLAAYRAAPDAGQAFRHLAASLLNRGKYRELDELIKLHRQKQADDVWLGFYAGKLHVHGKAWDPAVQVLGEALKKAPDDVRFQFRWAYVDAMYRAGRGLQAYRECMPEVRTETFNQLTHALARDRNGAELEQLINAHRPHATDPAELLFLQARARVFGPKPADATPLIHQACQQQKAEHRRRYYVTVFVQDMDKIGQPQKGYRAAPDQHAAFEQLASLLVNQKREDKLKELLEEHANSYPQAPLLHHYRGEWLLLRKQAKEAEQEFAAARAQAPAEEWRSRHGLHRARVLAGRTVETYRELGPGRDTFEQLGYICTSDKNPEQLRLLLAAHRAAEPDDPGLPVWQVELYSLQEDYAGALRLLTEQRQGAFALPRYRWKFANLQVRTLVLLKRSKEAVQEAEALVKSGMGSTALLVLAHASGGDAKQLIALVDRLQLSPGELRECYQLEELGPILKSPAFAEFRGKFPEPVDEPDDDPDD
jgi:predicted Zn-dependent protease